MLSFYYTERVALYVKNKNPLMQTLEEIKETKYVSSINSTIIDDIYIIPGINGKEVNLEKSFSNMHEYNLYNEDYLVFNEIKPSISLTDNKDKIIIKGNKKKQSVSLIFESINNLSNYMYQHKYKVNLLINGETFDNKYELINNSNQVDVYNNVEKYLTKNKINKQLCYIKDIDKIPSICKNKYMFIPTLIINHSNLSSNINKVSSGDIILIKDTLTITELELLIDQISFRNLKIVPLSELINEKNIN
jgi:hypothetical protein